ncbi:hypothetical protein CW714_01525 [Methanophagales archaeon]|nr:MAG: hypothetical protein CW714_01525 [Methanophagales archaeon]
MIVTEKKPFGMIKAKLKKSDKISIVSCNMCARLCETGGKEGLEEIKEKLKEDGYNPVDEFLFSPVCDRTMVKKVVKPKGNVILVLACDAGFVNIKSEFKNKTAIQVLDTVGLGAFDENKNIFLIKEFKE